MKQTVLVTGSSRGIGKAIALKFAKEGYQVIINSIKGGSALEDVKKEVERFQVPCLSFTGDMGDYEQTAALFSMAKKQFGGIDVLVNNAGISYIGLLQDLTPKEWDTILRTNLTSVYNCCHLAIPDMIHKKSGHIINISSVWGIAGASCEAAYSATKGGINSFTMALGKELAPSGITVNAIACGAIDTSMNQFLSQEEKEALIEEIPGGRYGDPLEVANLAYELAGSHPYLNGQVIKLDGAWL